MNWCVRFHRTVMCWCSNKKKKKSYSQLFALIVACEPSNLQERREDTMNKKKKRKKKNFSATVYYDSRVIYGLHRIGGVINGAVRCFRVGVGVITPVPRVDNSREAESQVRLIISRDDWSDTTVHQWWGVTFNGGEEEWINFSLKSMRREASQVFSFLVFLVPSEEEEEESALVCVHRRRSVGEYNRYLPGPSRMDKRRRRRLSWVRQFVCFELFFPSICSDVKPSLDCLFIYSICLTSLSRKEVSFFSSSFVSFSFFSSQSLHHDARRPFLTASSEDQRIKGWKGHEKDDAAKRHTVTSREAWEPWWR